jgi:PKD repeat protein
VSFNSSTGVLSGTPGNGTTGNYTVTITATNAFGSTSQTFTLHVTSH